MSSAECADMLGITLVSVERTMCSGNDALEMTDSTGCVWTFWHSQDCCESVSIESIDGDFADIIGSPLTLADEATEAGDDDGGTSTWTFYRFGTIKGYVTVRWLGESNGYYSESVYLEKSEASHGA